MIAVALSGGVDSAAAAICLREKGLDVIGVLFRIGRNIPDPSMISQASEICSSLKIPFHVIDIQDEFRTVKQYFCSEYLSGRTPNPCAICNRDIKFGLFFEKVHALGADMIATGHYVRLDNDGDRFFLARAVENNSQEYFLGLLGQEVLKKVIFPLEGMTKDQARSLVGRYSSDIETGRSSQDVCFLKGKGYVPFIRSFAGFHPVPGDILDTSGSVIGAHRGALYYTPGQRKGLGMGFGRRVYVLEKDIDFNTVTIGDLDQWSYTGFIINHPNYMKVASIEGGMKVFVKTRYNQTPVPAVISPSASGVIRVLYPELFAAGQLAVIYDDDDAILCSGIITGPMKI